MRRIIINSALTLLMAGSLPEISMAQINNQDNQEASKDVIGRNNQSNVILTSASFLLIAPDSRSGALGDAGVATTPDVYSQHWNAAKYVFCEDRNGVSLSFTPWLKKYVDDMSISYLSGYHKIKETQSVGYSMTYFNLGDMQFTDYNGSTLKNFTPKEFAFDASYALKLADNLSGSVTMRYIYSNLTGGLALSGGSEETHAGQSVAGDIGIFYHKKSEWDPMSGTFCLGAQVSNIGAKLGYTKSSQNFIPTNLKLGTSYTLEIDNHNSFMLTADLNKLLVPTPPIYNESHDEILAGKDPDVGVITGIFQSFNDAPDGMEEELKEISYSIGAEYSYSQTLSGRMGYFSEHKDKGGRKYLTFGFGVRLKAFQFDLAYLVATTASNPLQNTIRFSLGINLDNSKK